MNLQGSKTAVALVLLSAFVPNLCMVGSALAQATADDTMNATAKIVNPLRIDPSINLKLNFQSFAVRGNGSYIVKAGGTETIASGVTIGGATPGTALLKVPQSVPFTLSIPTFKASSILLKNAGGGVPSKEMTLKSLLFAGKSGIDGITSNLSKGNASITNIKITNPADTGTFFLGARIVFDATDQIGTYQGSFIVRITL